MSGYWTALFSRFGEYLLPALLVPSSHPLPFSQRLCARGAVCCWQDLTEGGRKPLTKSSGIEFPVLLQVGFLILGLWVAGKGVVLMRSELLLGAGMGGTRFAL